MTTAALATRHGLAGRATVLLCALAAACQSSTEPDLLDVAPDALPLIQTDAASYRLEFDGIGYTTSIPYTFANRTDAPVYLVNCNGSFAIHLERWEEGEWTPVWAPVIAACLSLPIVIESDSVFVRSLRVWWATPGKNLYPVFDVDDPSGTYRLVWDDGRTSYQDHLPFGELLPLAYRVSNVFELVLE